MQTDQPRVANASKTPTAAAQPGSNWYDLDYLTPYRDLFLIVGYLILAGGAALFWYVFTKNTLIAGASFGMILGAGMVWLGLRMAR